VKFDEIGKIGEFAATMKYSKTWEMDKNLYFSEICEMDKKSNLEKR